jgi:hypothetical protein
LPADRGRLHGKQRGYGEQSDRTKFAETHLRWLLTKLDNLLRSQWSGFPAAALAPSRKYLDKSVGVDFVLGALSHE